jgi:hypothetical protein
MPEKNLTIFSIIKNKACIILEAKYNKGVAATGMHKKIIPKNNIIPKNGTTNKLAGMVIGDIILKWNATIGHVPINTAADENKTLITYENIFSVIDLKRWTVAFLRLGKNTVSNFGVRKTIKNTQEKES